MGRTRYNGGFLETHWPLVQGARRTDFYTPIKGIRSEATPLRHNKQLDSKLTPCTGDSQKTPNLEGNLTGANQTKSGYIRSASWRPTDTPQSHPRTWPSLNPLMGSNTILLGSACRLTLFGGDGGYGVFRSLHLSGRDFWGSGGSPPSLYAHGPTSPYRRPAILFQ